MNLTSDERARAVAALAVVLQGVVKLAVRQELMTPDELRVLTMAAEECAQLRRRLRDERPPGALLSLGAMQRLARVVGALGGAKCGSLASWIVELERIVDSCGGELTPERMGPRCSACDALMAPARAPGDWVRVCPCVRRERGES